MCVCVCVCVCVWQYINFKMLTLGSSGIFSLLPIQVVEIKLCEAHCCNSFSTFYFALCSGADMLNMDFGNCMFGHTQDWTFPQ